MRPKGRKNKKWSKEEKLRIVKRYYDERISRSELAQSEGISSDQIWTWLDKYQKFGEKGLENKKKNWQ
ncbi:MAG: transposase [Breznakia sp.]